MTSKPFLLRFKFANFANLPSDPGSYLYSDRITDRRHGNVWQLQLYPGGTKISQNSLTTTSSGGQQSGKTLTSVFLHNVDGPDVNAKTTFLVRDAHGNVFHKESSEDVDCYKALRDCFGYFAFVKRSAILEETNNVLLRGTLIIDVEVQTADRPQRLV